MSKLTTTTRELAAAWIGRTIGATGGITLERAAQILAEANMQDWDALTDERRQWYERRGDDLLGRISEGPRGLPDVEPAVVWVVQALESP